MENTEKSTNDGSHTQLIGDKNKIVTSISQFYNNQEHSDIVLKLGSKCFYAHKFVLMLMSDVFKTMCSKRWDCSKIDEIELSESEQCIPVFPLFLQFLYHGQVYVNTTTALPLLMLADKYNVETLKTSCEDYVKKQIEEGNVIGAIRWLPYLQLCDQVELEKACIEVIVIEMDYVISSEDFSLLNLDLLTMILQRDDLVVPYEYSLYSAVVKWIQSKQSDQHAQERYVAVLMPLIRFSMMFPEHLLQVEKSPFFIAHQTIMSPYLSLAHRFRSLAPDIADDGFTGSLYTPRNYTNPGWCYLVNIDADNTSFFSKSYNFHAACSLLPSATKSTDATWNLQVVRSERPDHSSSGFHMSQQDGLWHSHMPSGPSKSKGNLPLQINIRPLKPLNAHIVTDISLFRVKNNSVCKHLVSTTYFSKDNASKSVFKCKDKSIPFSVQPSPPDRIFQPSPMHFSFGPQPATLREHEASLKYVFSQDELESPPEVPCVSFGPSFGNLPRPIYTLALAIIIKPRFKSPNDSAGIKSDSHTSVVADDKLPIFG